MKILFLAMHLASSIGVAIALCCNVSIQHTAPLMFISVISYLYQLDKK